MVGEVRDIAETGPFPCYCASCGSVAPLSKAICIRYRWGTGKHDHLCQDCWGILIQSSMRDLESR